MSPHDFGADGVEGAEPLHAFDNAADEIADAVLHFLGGFVGEGYSHDLAGERLAGRQKVTNTGCEHARFAGASACQHE